MISDITVKATLHSPFNAWCPLKGHTYLNKHKYVWPFYWTTGAKGLKQYQNVINVPYLQNSLVQLPWQMRLLNYC